MDIFAMYFGYFCIYFVGIFVFGCIIYWLYQLYEYCSFTFKHYRCTDKYFYKIVHVGKWHENIDWPGARSYIEYYYVKRRARYHIFSKFETLYKLNTAEEAEDFLDSHIKFENSNK